MLPEHVSQNFTAQQSAEKIAAHFSAISQEFLPLNAELLTDDVLNKLKCPGKPPSLSEFEVYKKILHANKPKSGTPSDIPREIVSEFSPELASPLAAIYNNMFKSGEWPEHWKLEYVIPIMKVPKPKTENDLRPISLTPFFSKVAEHFVVEWLLEYIGDKIDVRQYGGLKRTSTTHYMIEFLDFILSQLDTPKTAVMACYIDFSKAFNRQDHNLLIQKLSKLGVPGWLLNIVMSFLSNRTMIVRYNGSESSKKALPGGGPQGTVLALLLFIVLINEIGCPNCYKRTDCLREIHLKFVDDLTIAQAVDLKVPDVDNSLLKKQLHDTEVYATDNSMKINFSKTQLMVFNPCWSVDFVPQLSINSQDLSLVTEKRLLGLIVRNDLKWSSNTENIVRNASKRLWILRRLKYLGANKEVLLQVYTKQIRSVLEYSVPAWQGGITASEKTDLERVQKCAIRIILGYQYSSYTGALLSLGLENLESRRIKLCLNFALKAEKHPKFSSWFIPSLKSRDTRTRPNKYSQIRSKHKRFDTGPISYLTDLLNQHYRNLQ